MSLVSAIFPRQSRSEGDRSRADLSVDHFTIGCWVQRYSRLLNQRMRREMRQPNRSWRVDATCFKVAGNRTYLYRPVDSCSDTIDFMLSPKRDLSRRSCSCGWHCSAADPPSVSSMSRASQHNANAFAELKQSRELGRCCLRGTVPYLNNIIESDHPFIKEGYASNDRSQTER